ncbi:MAG: regulatory protein RecX [Clostridiales bacterium]|jgi:SOS response regulatory protein OraA/RecX|nr:regulatory protein RecX [Clostridiales bacterium]
MRTDIDFSSGEEAYKRAIRILSRSSRGEHELYAKLLDYGFTEEASAHALGKCVERGYADDFSYAESVARRMSRSGKGVYRVREYLKAKQVKDEAIEHALREYETDEGKLQRILDNYLKGRRSREDLKKAKAMLYRRGYRPEEIDKAIAELPETE